jgi:hypothetical protein
MTAGADDGATREELELLRAGVATALASVERLRTAPAVPPLSRHVLDQLAADLGLAARRTNWLIAAAARRGVA